MNLVAIETSVFNKIDINSMNVKFYMRKNI